MHCPQLHPASVRRLELTTLASDAKRVPPARERAAVRKLVAGGAADSSPKKRLALLKTRKGAEARPLSAFQRFNTFGN